MTGGTPTAPAPTAPVVGNTHPTTPSVQALGKSSWVLGREAPLEAKCSTICAVTVTLYVRGAAVAHASARLRANVPQSIVVVLPAAIRNEIVRSRHRAIGAWESLVMAGAAPVRHAVALREAPGIRVIPTKGITTLGGRVVKVPLFCSLRCAGILQIIQGKNVFGTRRILLGAHKTSQFGVLLNAPTQRALAVKRHLSVVARFTAQGGWRDSLRVEVYAPHPKKK